MKFRTEISIKDAPKNLSPERLVVLAGSCFSDNIGGRMKLAGWPAEANPFGVIYNPVSMAVLFQLAMSHPAVRREIIESSITMREGRYVSWFVGATCMADTPEDCVDRVCDCIERLEGGIEKGSALILTFGTADVWLLAGTDRAVGNCHKHPAAEFEKRRVTVEEICTTWTEMIRAMRMRNPELKIFLTVSPRRYLSDGFAENSRQKAVLLLACEQLEKTLQDVYYFPAYEILNDDLRDYRFYDKDLLHPSEMAIEYIWEKFCEFTLTTGEWEKLKAMEKEARRGRHIEIGNKS